MAKAAVITLNIGRMPQATTINRARGARNYIDAKFLPAITVLLVYQLVGEVITRGLELPIPGPVIGMLLLFVTLLIRGRAPASVQATANALLQHLSLLYIPAGVGIMVYFEMIRAEWLALTLTLIASTVATIAITALVMWSLLQWARTRKSRREAQHG